MSMWWRLHLINAALYVPRSGCAQLGWTTFMMTCLCWILGYMRLEIWHKIGFSGACGLCTVLRTRSGACYYWNRSDDGHCAFSNCCLTILCYRPSFQRHHFQRYSFRFLFCGSGLNFFLRIIDSFQLVWAYIGCSVPVFTRGWERRTDDLAQVWSSLVHRVLASSTAAGRGRRPPASRLSLLPRRHVRANRRTSLLRTRRQTRLLNIHLISCIFITSPPAHPIDGSGGIMFSGCPSVCVCVRSRVGAFSDWLAAANLLFQL